jgi:hypothetical protein
MTAELITRNGHEVTLQVTIDVSGTMLEAEGRIQAACNEVGQRASVEALKGFETDGSPIILDGIKWTKRCASPQTYQTPYGTVELERNVYQTSKGGKIYCPLDAEARIIRHATPLFARQLSHKYAQMNVNAVCADLGENHGRPVTASYVQNVADWVGGIACATEESWEYALPALEAAVATVAVSVDGARLAMKEEGWREVMVGSLSLYDLEGARRHTLYVAAAPEYGKLTFHERMTREIAQLKARYPKARYLGIADGASTNWSFLEQHTEQQLIDYFHAAEYLPAIALAAYPGQTDTPTREWWLHDRRHRLKHEPGAVEALIEEAQRLTRKRSLTRTVKEDLHSALTYFTNQKARMDYPTYLAENLPIGSGVVEAACKTLVKQRLCGAGMRWKHQGAKVILSLRALIQSTGRWAQFWEKIEQFGAQPC